MKFLIAMGLLLSPLAKASISHQVTGKVWVNDCNANQIELSIKSEKKAIERAIQMCGTRPSTIHVVDKGISLVRSPYAEGCLGILSYHTIEFSCPNDQFSVIGVSIEGSFGEARDAALKEAIKLCSGRPIERVSEWVDSSRYRNYWFEFRVSALFRCL